MTRSDPDACEFCDGTGEAETAEGEIIACDCGAEPDPVLHDEDDE